MAICELHFSADSALQRMSSAMVLLPEKKSGPFPVLYLLHGQTDDHTAWTRNSNIARYVDNLPLIVVMPNTERGWYVNAARDPSRPFETYIIDDLLPFIDATFNTRADRSGRALAGLSMGGYGAFTLAAKHPELFCAAHGFSSGFARGRQDLTDDPEFRLVFGDKPAGTRYDIFALMEQVAKQSNPAAFSFDCGVSDFTIDVNRELHRHMASLGIPHIYEEYPGAHDWAYWNEHVLTALPRIARQLGILELVNVDAHLPLRHAPLSVL